MSKKRALTPQEKNWGSKKGAKYAKNSTNYTQHTYLIINTL